MSKKLLESIKPGDKVTIMIPSGIGREGQEYKPATGKAVIRGDAGAWVLDLGGAYGTPGIATEKNIVAVKHTKKQVTAAAAFLAYGLGGRNG